MIETVPPRAIPPPDRRRFYRWLLYIGVSAVLLLGLLTVCLNMNAMLIEARQVRNDENITTVGIALLKYAEDHQGHLPPTLWELIPKYVSQEDFTEIRFCHVKGDQRSDWLYFPREIFQDLADDTVLLATPDTFPLGTESQWRLCWTSDSNRLKLREADFQRLIREQNPQPAFK